MIPSQAPSQPYFFEASLQLGTNPSNAMNVEAVPFELPYDDSNSLEENLEIWYCGGSVGCNEANTNTQPDGLQANNDKGITIALLQDPDGNLYLVLIYGSGNGSGGRATVTTSGNGVDGNSGINRLVYADDGGEGGSFPTDVSWRWVDGKTDGFIVAVNTPNTTSSQEICYEHTSLTNIENLRFVPAKNDPSDPNARSVLGVPVSIVAEDRNAILDELFCIRLSSVT